MLTIHIRPGEFWDETNCKFITVPECIIELEHSLYTVDKWESKWHVPFLSDKREKSEEELLSYIKCMTINDVPDEIYSFLTSDDLGKINDYISDPMTATTIQRKRSPSNSIVTSEVLYYSMISFGIPFECQHWHLNKLITLIEVCDIKGNSQKKMTDKETMMSNKALNAMNRARFKSKG